jgi:4-amino-4-deoxy-L-arabinose transferase-like glycosyltransferase
MFALLYKIVPLLPVEVYGRLVTIFFSLVIIAIIYYFVLKEYHRIGAIFAAIIFAVFPAFVFYSRVVLPETTAVAFSFIALFLLYRWKKSGDKKKHVLLVVSAVCFALAILIKPTVLFFGLAVAYFFFVAYRFRLYRRWDVWLYALITLLPFLAWRLYILKYPEGIPASDWLITKVNTYQGQETIFLKPAFFRWIFYERINLMIFGGYLTAFFVTGLFTKLKRPFLHLILISSMIYLFVFEGGNVQHEYYQTVIFPVLAIFAGIGIGFFFKERKNAFINPLFMYPLIMFIMVLGWSFSYYYKIKGNYNYPQDLNQMAKIIDTFTRPTDKVITDRMGDTTLLYLADRKGAPMLYHTLEQLKGQGYSYYMTDQKGIISTLKEEKKYQLLFENNQFAFFKL